MSCQTFSLHELKWCLEQFGAWTSLQAVYISNSKCSVGIARDWWKNHWLKKMVQSSNLINKWDFVEQFDRSIDLKRGFGPWVLQRDYLTQKVDKTTHQNSPSKKWLELFWNFWRPCLRVLALILNLTLNLWLL